MSDKMYVIDTSSWIAIFAQYPTESRQKILEGIDTLILQGRIKSPRGVYGKISQKKDDLYLWIKDREKIFVNHGKEMIKLAGEIKVEYPHLVNHNRSEISADPYVIALAIHLKRGIREIDVVIVTEESDNPKRTSKIPYVAHKKNMSTINLDALLDLEALCNEQDRQQRG